jgi:UDP-N-acetylmuramate: L-alanyl-gamma-D-glutamyl-meso-diaminopimelate ligase
MGVHRELLAPSLVGADKVFLFQPSDAKWSMDDVAVRIGQHAGCYSDIEKLVDALSEQARPGDNILVMSNGGFGNIHQRILERLS